MPPALVPLALVAVGIPAALRAAFGWPRSLARSWMLAFAAVAIAQAAGELTGSRVGVLGDAQLLLAAFAALVAAVGLAVAERDTRR